MAVRAWRRLYKDVCHKRAFSSPIASARHCSSAAETAPKIPHFSKKVSSFVMSRKCLLLCISEKFEILASFSL